MVDSHEVIWKIKLDNVCKVPGIASTRQQGPKCHCYLAIIIATNKYSLRPSPMRPGLERDLTTKQVMKSLPEDSECPAHHSPWHIIIKLNK